MVSYLETLPRGVRMQAHENGHLKSSEAVDLVVSKRTRVSLTVRPPPFPWSHSSGPQAKEFSGMTRNAV